MARQRGNRSRRIPVSKYPFSPSTYPGMRPRFSFFFTPKGIYRVKLRTLNRFLADRKLPPTTERFAVVAYGSNACPGQLLRKYRKHRLTNVPVLFGRVLGAEAVYAHRQTIKDRYIPATLARETGSRSSWVTLLAADQFEAMDASEGRPGSYELAKLSGVQFFVGRKEVFPLYAYLNIRGGVMTFDGKAVNLRFVGQKRAKRIFDRTTEQPATAWLGFEIIPDQHRPPEYSKILKR